MINWPRAMHGSREALHRSPGERRRTCETAAFPSYGAGADSTPTPRSIRGASSRAAKASPKVLTVLKKACQDAYGTWKVFVFAQDVNRVAPGTPPEIAAQTIGGFFVASAIRDGFFPGAAEAVKAQGRLAGCWSRVCSFARTLCAPGSPSSVRINRASVQAVPAAVGLPAV